MKLVLLALSFNGLLFSNSNSAVIKDKKAEQPAPTQKQVLKRVPTPKPSIYWYVTDSLLSSKAESEAKPENTPCANG